MSDLIFYAGGVFGTREKLSMVCRFDPERAGGFSRLRGSPVDPDTERCENQMCVISVIIPVYNVEKYLKKCLDSLCGCKVSMQYEIILSEDGSQDRSASICGSYAEKYKHITVIHGKHAGAAAARNAGLKKARGTYILFLDADDFLAEGAFADLEQQMQDQADFYFLKMQKIYPGGRLRSLEKMDDFYLRDRGKSYGIRYLAGLARFPGSACAKLIRRELILQHAVFFEEGVTAEDLVWTLRCILHAKTYRYLDRPFYYYRQMRDGSVTSVTTAQRLEHLHHAIAQGTALAKQKTWCRYKHEIYRMMAYEAEVFFLLYGGRNRAVRIQCEAMAVSVCGLLWYRREIKTWGLRGLIGLFGVRRGARVMYVCFQVLSFLNIGLHNFYDCSTPD